MSWLSDLIGGGASKIIDSVTDGVDKFVTTDDEKKELALKKQEALLNLKKLQMEVEEGFLKDKQSARSMYMKDSQAQKILTYLFTAGFFVGCGFMVYAVVQKQALNQSAIMLISTIFGALSAGMTMILSFYFGSSKGGEDQGRQIQEAFENSKK